jgi:opacity protein-like surface antigen
LTLGRDAFNTPTLGAELSYRLAPRLDLVFGGAYAGTSRDSEFRDWVDQDDLPIEQTTSFRRMPLTVSLKTYITPPGRKVGNIAWIPARYAAYLGAGGGTIWYRFSQRGDFVDIDSPDYEIFTDSFDSSGWTPTGHLLAGIDYSLTPRLALNTEGRYTWAKTDLSGDFVGFDPIDLSGLSVTLGLSIRL